MQFSLKKLGNRGMGALSVEAKSVGALAVLIAIALALIVGVRNSFITNVAGCNSTHANLCGAEYNSTHAFVGAMGTYSSYAVVIVLIGIGVYLLTRLKDF